MKKYILTLLFILVLGASYTTAQADDVDKNLGLTPVTELTDGAYYYIVNPYAGFYANHSKYCAFVYNRSYPTAARWGLIDKTNLDTDINYVYQLKKGSDGWYIISVASGMYVDAPSNYFITLATSPTLEQTITYNGSAATGNFRITNTNTGLYCFYPDGAGGSAPNYGGNRSNNVGCNNWSIDLDNAALSYWRFYPVTDAMKTLIGNGYTLSDNTYYNIVSNFTGFGRASGTQAMCYKTNSTLYPYWNALSGNEGDPKYIFKLKKGESYGWYIQNAYNEKYFGERSKTSEGDQYNDLTRYSTEASTPFIITYLGNDVFSLMRQGDSYYVYVGSYGGSSSDYLSSNSTGGSTSSDTPADAGKWKFQTVNESYITAITTTKESLIPTLVSTITASNGYGNTANYVFGMTEDKYNKAVNMTADDISLEKLNNSDLSDFITPLTTGYYRIQNYYWGLNDKTHSILRVDANRVLYADMPQDGDETKKDLSTVFKIVVPDNQEGSLAPTGLKITTQGRALVSSTTSKLTGTGGYGDDGDAQFLDETEGNTKPVASLVKPSSYRDNSAERGLRVSDVNGNYNRKSFYYKKKDTENESSGYPRHIAGWSGIAETSHWNIIPATDIMVDTHAVGGETYATLYAPFALTLPTGLKAYTATLNEDKNLLTLTDVGSTIPAATPVILIGDGATPTYYTLPIDATNTAEAVTSSLTGQYLGDTTDDTGELTLGYVTNDANKKVVGFYPYSGTIGANKARLSADAVSSSKGFTFSFGDDDPTGINTATVSGATLTVGDVIYDLQGRRVQDAKHGIYIINGKKTVVK